MGTPYLGNADCIRGSQHCSVTHSIQPGSASSPDEILSAREKAMLFRAQPSTWNFQSFQSRVWIRVYLLKICHPSLLSAYARLYSLYCMNVICFALAHRTHNLLCINNDNVTWIIRLFMTMIGSWPPHAQCSIVFNQC